MTEGKCFFCQNPFWTEKVTICLDCLRDYSSLKKADFVFIAKGEYYSVLRESDLEGNIELLEKFILPSLKKRLKKEAERKTQPKKVRR